MKTEKREVIPFREGLFSAATKAPYLIGNRCQSCRRLFFPSRPFCFDCFSRRMRKARIGKQGTLYSFTTSYMPSSQFQAPFTVGWIDLKEGIRIVAPILAKQYQILQIGMEMELVIDELWRNEKTRVFGYKYRPA
jgi:uncharacterized OB-fold protein